MKKTSLFILAASCTALATLTSASAQTQASSKPMGYVTYTAKGNSDTRIGAPVHRKAAFVGKVDSVANGNEITVEGTPAWTADEFTDATSASPPASELYFVLIASGNMEGRYFEVTANDTDTLTIDLAGASITADVVNGTSLKLIPYWTLDTLFPDGAGVLPSQDFGTLNTEILVPDGVSAGTNLVNSDTFFYYDGSIGGAFATPGWRRAGSSPFTDYGNAALAPDLQLIVRNNLATDTTIVPIGDVFTTSFKSLVNVVATGVDQDNAVFLTVPIDVSLTDSNLFESGVFAGNAGFAAADSDSLLVYDGNAVSQNKVNAKTYFYYTGAAVGGPGWRESGTSPLIIRDAEIAFSLDSQVIIRKKGLSSGSQVWSMTPSYLPFP